jgi:uncharacterized protein (DUF433 family)
MIEQIVEYYEAGVSIEDIGEKYNLSNEDVVEIINDNFSPFDGD